MKRGLEKVGPTPGHSGVSSGCLCPDPDPTSAAPSLSSLGTLLARPRLTHRAAPLLRDQGRQTVLPKNTSRRLCPR